MSAIFELYFSVGEIAQRLDVSDKWVRARVQAGEFGCNIVLVAGELRVPLSGVLFFLGSRRLNGECIAAAVADRMRPLPQRVFSEKPGIPARSDGELRRKSEVVDDQ